MHGAGPKARPGGRPVIHGRYATKHAPEIQNKLTTFLDDPRPLDLTHELALSRATLQQYLDRLTDNASAKELSYVRDHVDHIARTVGRIVQMLNDTALTAHELDYSKKRMADIILRYVPEDRRDACAGEIRSVFGLGGRSAHPDRVLAATAP